jgi:AraC-like DNA-binding protein
MMDYAELSAPPPLDALVKCFWFLRGDDAEPEPQVIVADGRIEIILHLRDAFSRYDNDGVVRRQSSVLLSGQILSPLRVRATGSTDIVGIRFRTAAASAVLRVPLADITHRVDALSDVAPELGETLHAAASRNENRAARVAALSDVLMRHVVREPDPLAAAAIRSLDASHAPAVSRIADAYGVSARTLERKVLDATGLPPSSLRRVLRFRRAFRLLDQAPPGTWARTATRTGYFDQAHMIRDFRQFAGVAPSEFFKTDPALARAILIGAD